MAILTSLRHRLICAAAAARARERGDLDDGHLWGPARMRMETVLTSERTCRRCGLTRRTRHADADVPTLNTRGPDP